MRRSLVVATLALAACQPAKPQPYTYDQLFADYKLAMVERHKCNAAQYSNEAWRDDYCRMVEYAMSQSFMARKNKL